MIQSVRVDVVCIARSANRSIRQSLSERFMSVQIDDCSILVLDGENKSSNVVDVGNSERLLVQLNLVCGGREVAIVALSPSLSRSRGRPISRDFSHLVEPARMGRNRILNVESASSGKIDSRIISHTKNGFHLVARKNSTNIKVRSIVPISSSRSNSRNILGSGNTSYARPILIVRLTRISSNRHNHLLIRSILDFETLISGATSIGTKNIQHCSSALLNRESKRSRVSVAIHHRGHSNCQA